MGNVAELRAEIERLREQQAKTNLQWASDFAEANAEIERLRLNIEGFPAVLLYARNETLEEAAKVAELHGPYAIARAIRALKG